MNRSMQVAALVVAVASAGGCKKGLDKSDADAKLKAWGEADVGMPIKSVSCPDAKLEAGNKFECEAEFVAGKKATIIVEVKDDKGNVVYYWKKGITSGEKMSGLIAAGIKEKTGKVVAVDCGKGLLDLEPDGVKCNGTADGTTVPIAVKYDGKTHQVSWEAVPQPPQQ